MSTKNFNKNGTFNGFPIIGAKKQTKVDKGNYTLTLELLEQLKEIESQLPPVPLIYKDNLNIVSHCPIQHKSRMQLTYRETGLIGIVNYINEIPTYHLDVQTRYPELFNKKGEYLPNAIIKK